MTDEEQGGLFEVAELAPLPNARRAEAGVMAALTAALESKLITATDGGLVAGVLIAARALDRAEAMPDHKAVYAVAQLLPQLQKALHGLGLPLEPGPVAGERLPDPTPSAASAPSWLSDLGTPR